MNHKVSVARCLVRGVSLWRVRWHGFGRVRLKFFPLARRRMVVTMGKEPKSQSTAHDRAGCRRSP